MSILFYLLNATPAKLNPPKTKKRERLLPFALIVF